MKIKFFYCILQWTTVVAFITFPFSDLFAQEKLQVKFGKVTPPDFDISSKLIDSNSNAVVVANVGNSEFEVNSARKGFSLSFQEKKRIKLLNKNGFEAATIEIPLYVDGNTAEKLESLKAYTYNLENGKVTETKVEGSAVLTENRSKHLIIKKFTFPSIKEGSIIEYSYTVSSAFLFNLQPWEFQGQYPCLWSEYNTSIPEFFKYVTLSQGSQSFIINKEDQTETNYTFRQDATVDSREGRIAGENQSLKGIVFNHRWVMKDLPALKEEAYTTTVNNYIAKIEFQLGQIVYPNSSIENVMGDWYKVSEELLQSEDFGLSLNRANNWLDDDMKLIAGDASPEQKARLIFAYVRDNFTCNNYYARYLTGSLKDVFKNKSGNVADINLLLIAMLHHEKINAEPVLLSTRSRGITHEYYPLMNRYNYVIAQVFIDNKIYFLDAARQRIGFNKLSDECYNGNARIITKEPAACFFSPDSLRELKHTVVIITNNDKKEVEGFYNSELGYYESFDLRNKLAKMPLEVYVKEIKSTSSSEIQLSNIVIDSLKKYEEPVSVKYDIRLKGFGDEDIVYFNPMFSEGLKKNPFVSAERLYPVEMPYLTNEIYSLNMEIPEGYVVDELPKSAKVKFNEDEGMFEYIVSKDANYIQLRCRLSLERTQYLPEDYQSLRDFFSYVVKKESEQIVFKKKK
jgi:hypothetical protein